MARDADMRAKPSAAAAGGADAARARDRLPDHADAFLTHLVTQRRASPQTVIAYRRNLAQLAELAGADPTAIAQADIRRAAARLHAAGQSPASIARALSAWRGFFKWLGEQRRVAINPALGVRAPKRAKRLPKALAVDQAVQLTSQAPADSALALRDRALVELLYSSGLRLAELVSLDWRHFEAEPRRPASASWIDLAAGEATVTGKGRKTRGVPIGAAARAALADWLAVRGSLAGGEDRALFVSAQGRRIAPRSVALRLAALAKKVGLGVHVHPHVLRHSMASHVLQSSGDLRAVQELLGHASISTTQIYTRLDWQHLAKAYDAAHPRAKRKAG